ncbi:MAG TPA: thioredoxin domain-containing protein [Alphaproteobacteria bacterium]|nr:thioredoxin domain-containing protein [Alphaproteobacteria bacterium]
MSGNLLAGESSPYLQQHRDNPVHWRPWGEAALAEARDANKPIMLSIGYSSCHWCHVMAHESFEHLETAALMNELFVNIKVDREERPDLDAIYQRAISLMGQQGGWPLTMFLNPDGEPFWGGTYFPREPRFGRPGFQDVLKQIHGAYTNEPENVRKNQTNMVEALRKMADNNPGEDISEQQIENIGQMLLREVDPRHGGIGGAPKFPQVPILDILWRNYKRTGSELMRTAVLLSARQMSEGGIYDHLGGGYSRYSTDERWLVPHFEKMLYDNAQLLELISELWQDTQEPVFKQRAEETVAWLLRDMVTGEGAFASALDADSEGEEGRFYVWQESEIDALLGTDSEAFKAVYDVSPQGNFEGNNILNRLRYRPDDDALDEADIKPLRDKLLAVRDKRIWPSWDDKVLADWNGMMITALAFAAAVFERPDWLQAARRAWDYVADEMADGDHLRHSARHGQVKKIEFLDDYADMSRAALMLFETSGEPAFLERAQGWMKIIDTHYWDAEAGGYFYSPNSGETLIARSKSAHDMATPSGNGTLVGVLARLYHLTAEDAYLERAGALVRAFSGEIGERFAPMPTLINNSELLTSAMQIVIVGARGEADCDAMIRATYSLSLPNRVMRVIDPGSSMPAGHPAAGKTQQDGKVTAYLCVGPTCSLPVTDAGALRALLQDALEPGPGRGAQVTEEDA